CFVKNERTICEYSVPMRRADGARNPKITLGHNCAERPVVAVLLAQSDYKDNRYAIEKPYVDVLIDNELCPVFISWTNVNEQLAIWRPDGILVPGGTFAILHSQTVTEFAGDPSYRGLRRGFAYTIMLDYARHHKLPTLGICAGAQKMAIFLGGKLIGRINEFGATINHKDIHGPGHEIEIMPNTLLRRIVGQKDITVNTSHNSAIYDKAAGDFIVSARAPDGIIEAIEPKNPWSDFVLGVQWHPELMAATGISGGASDIFSAFADAIKTKHAMQRIIVIADGTRAIVSLVEGGRTIATFPGFVGRRGAGFIKREGDGQTPFGEYRMGLVFGTGELDTRMPHRVIKEDDVWVDDPKSPQYNTWQKRGGKWDSAEDMLIDEYEFGAVIEYNTDTIVPGRGSAIFLHVATGPTAGCVGVSRDDMQRILRWMDPAKSPVMRIEPKRRK
ncbi:MAG: gamma-glutamyl-gamma-aminobutyrate hydrolase family protein, partial [Alphaproteobacteria bacterium]|nr:gamma-glutamyl-gamma-aminobutyrate hydrolase family protein [Alphaproteobacteria bacterium]